MKNTYANKPNTLQGFTSLYPYTKPSIKYSSKQQAFTIVELLIVIVVIAILAAISIAAYTNIQQRAKNTAIINAASQSLKMIQSYIAMNGDYPLRYNACITVDSGCQVDLNSDSIISSNSTFNTIMATVGTLPKSVPVEGSRWYGITYGYSASTTFDGVSQPVILRYYLSGKDQQCGIPRVMKRTAVTGVLVTSIDGFTSYVAGPDKTACLISISGPAHS